VVLVLAAVTDAEQGVAVLGERVAQFQRHAVDALGDVALHLRHRGDAVGIRRELGRPSPVGAEHRVGVLDIDVEELAVVVVGAGLVEATLERRDREVEGHVERPATVRGSPVGPQAHLRAVDGDVVLALDRPLGLS